MSSWTLSLSDNAIRDGDYGSGILDRLSGWTFDITFVEEGQLAAITGEIVEVDWEATDEGETIFLVVRLFDNEEDRFTDEFYTVPIDKLVTLTYC